MPTTVAEKFGVVHLPICPFLSIANPQQHQPLICFPHRTRPATVLPPPATTSPAAAFWRKEPLSIPLGDPTHTQTTGCGFIARRQIVWGFCGSVVQWSRCDPAAHLQERSSLFFVLFALRHRLLLLNPAAQKLQHHTLDHSPPLDSFQSSPWLSI